MGWLRANKLEINPGKMGDPAVGRFSVETELAFEVLFLPRNLQTCQVWY